MLKLLKGPLLIILIVLSFTAKSQNKIVADISNFVNDKGVCRVCLFNNTTSFNGEGGKPYQCLQTTVKSKTSQAVFESVPSGTYAIFVFHDTNNNNKMDKNFLGIPKEGYGASKNKLPFASAPSFNDNKFSVDNNSTIQLNIKLRNL